MQLDQVSKSRLMSTSSSDCQRIEEYAQGTYIAEFPESLVIMFGVENIDQSMIGPQTSDEVNQRQLEKIECANEGTGVRMAEDKVVCSRCSGPETIYRGVKIFFKYNYSRDESDEVGNRLRALCSDCSASKLLDSRQPIVTHNELIKQWCDKVGYPWCEPVLTPVARPGDITNMVNSGDIGGLSSLGYAGSRNRKGYRGIDRKFTRSVPNATRTAVDIQPKTKTPVTFRYTHDYWKLATEKFKAGLMTEEQYEFVMDDLDEYLVW